MLVAFGYNDVATGVALLIGGAVALFVWASRTMGAEWAIVARTRADARLVTAGPFAYVRNPIYVALGLFMLAMAVVFKLHFYLLLVRQCSTSAVPRAEAPGPAVATPSS